MGQKIESFGGIILFILIVCGAVLSVITAITPDGFSFAAFVTSLITWGIYALIAYCAYHIVSLLLSAFAEVVENTYIMANIAVYNAAKEEGVLKKKSEATFLYNCK